MNNHTKGPWTIKSAAKDLSFLIQQYRDACEESEELNQRFDPTLEITKANARLMASAPELLEALKQCLGCIDQHTDDVVIGPIIDNAKQAIAKAEGVTR